MMDDTEQHAVLMVAITSAEIQEIWQAESLNHAMNIIMRHRSPPMICAAIDSLPSPIISIFILSILRNAETEGNVDAQEILKLARKLKIKGVYGLEEIEEEGIILLASQNPKINNN